MFASVELSAAALTLAAFRFSNLSVIVLLLVLTLDVTFLGLLST